ncbi:hypothetical protein D3C86_846640 [compost metagenome]
MADVAARDRPGPGIVRVRVINRGAIEAGQGRRAGRAGQGGDVIGGVAVLLARQLQAHVEVVLDRTGREGAVQVGDVGQGFGRVPARLGAPLHPPDAVDERRAARRGVEPTAVAGIGDDVVVQRLRVAGDVADRQGVAEAVIDGQGQAVDRVVQVVARLQPVEAVVGHVQNAAVGRSIGGGEDLVEQRDAVVRHLIAVEVVVAGGDRGRRAEAGGDGGGDAPLVEVDGVAARDVALRRHDIQAHGGGGTDLPVGVHRAARIGIRADAGRAVDEVLQARGLGAQVDAAAARAAPRIDRVRPLDDLDLLQVEDLALLAAGVADAVDEDVVARGLAADEGTVGQGLAAFAGAEGDARRGAQNILKRGGGGLLDDLLRDHRDRARRVDQGGDEGGILGLALDALAMHVDGAQGRRVLRRIRRDDRGFVRGQNRRGAQHAGGAGGEQKRLEGGGTRVGHGGGTSQ